MKLFKTPLCHLLAALFTITGLATAVAETNDSTAIWSHTVPFELGDAKFDTGDSITILKVTGTSDLITTGQTYCVEGTYTLNSHDEADLAWFMTGVSDSGSSPIDPRQIVRVTKGTGIFRLTRDLPRQGYLHLSFYPRHGGSDFGGVYFGEGKWVLHHGDYSQFAGHPTHPKPKLSSAQATVTLSESLSAPNLAMLEYLGTPVETPADISESYTPQGLRQAIQTAAQQAGTTVQKIEIEDSEFPPLVGVVCAHSDYEKLMKQINLMSGYTDQGSVGGHNCHTMNIIPWLAFPSGTGDRIQRRLTLREQMFYDKISRPE